MSHKRTGRTTRMLEEAIRLQQEGRAVYVMVGSGSEKERLENILYNGMGASKSIHVDNVHMSQTFDWDLMRLNGAHPNCICLVDHAVIERKFSPVLEMLHRYDKNPSEGAFAFKGVAEGKLKRLLDEGAEVTGVAKVVRRANGAQCTVDNYGRVVWIGDEGKWAEIDSAIKEAGYE